MGQSQRGVKKKKKECLIASISLKPEVKCLQWPVRPYKICPSILLTLWHLLLLPPPHLLSILLTLNSLLCPRQTMYTFLLNSICTYYCLFCLIYSSTKYLHVSVPNLLHSLLKYHLFNEAFPDYFTLKCNPPLP